MAKGAATEDALGELHLGLTKTFKDILADIANGEIEPNPAMLATISKFLKDNSIAFDSAEVDELNSVASKLAERRAARKAAGLDLASIPSVTEMN